MIKTIIKFHRNALDASSHTSGDVRLVAAAGKRGHQSALTLVESLIAISVLVIAVLGPMSIVAQALRTSYFTRDQMTAYYLAQEPIEYVRNIRDKNSLTKFDVTEWLNDMTVTGSPVINDVDQADPVKYSLTRDALGAYQLALCTANVCDKLNINTDTRLYGGPAGIGVRPSIYKREVAFFKAPGDDTAEQEVVIEVKMTWTQVGGTYTFKLRDSLANWKIANVPEDGI